MSDYTLKLNLSNRAAAPAQAAPAPKPATVAPRTQDPLDKFVPAGDKDLLETTPSRADLVKQFGTNVAGLDGQIKLYGDLVQNNGRDLQAIYNNAPKKDVKALTEGVEAKVKAYQAQVSPTRSQPLGEGEITAYRRMMMAEGMDAQLNTPQSEKLKDKVIEGWIGGVHAGGAKYDGQQQALKALQSQALNGDKVTTF